jgi:hypothetical protein
MARRDLECAYGQGQEDQTQTAPGPMARVIKGTPAKFIEFVEAPDAETAEAMVARNHRIPDALRDRLIALRENL